MESSRLTMRSTGSPTKSPAYYKLEDDKKNKLRILNFLFINYAARASRFAYKEMTQKCFMDLMEDVFQLNKSPLERYSDLWKRVSSIFYGRGKAATLDFDQFLKLLPAISGLFSSIKDTPSALKYLIEQLLLVYGGKVSQQIQGRFVNFDDDLRRDSQEYIGKLSEQLLIIYKLYFPQDMAIQNSEDAFSNLLTMFKEFELFPKVLNASQLYMIFQEVISKSTTNLFSYADLHNSRKQEKQTCLPFSKFIDILVRVAIVSANRLRDSENPEYWADRQKESLKTLLEYMESIKAKNKNTRFKQVRFSFILFQEYSGEEKSDYGLESGAGRDFFSMFEKIKF